MNTMQTADRRISATRLVWGHSARVIGYPELKSLFAESEKKEEESVRRFTPPCDRCTPLIQRSVFRGLLFKIGVSQ